MKLIYLVGLLVVLVIVDSEDEPINEPYETSNEASEEASDEASHEASDEASDDASDEASDEASDDVSDDVQSEFEIENDSEYGDKFEGDIILPNKTYNRQSFLVTGIRDSGYRWPKIDGLVRVPYVFDSAYSNKDKKKIAKAMNELQSKTCIKFEPRKNEHHYLHIVSQKGCWSYLGKQSGKQQLSLSRTGCIYHGTIIHELIHALGFGHQHSYHKRDESITIQWNNIKTSHKRNFEILDNQRFDNFGTDFDISSIMHYDDKAYTKNGKRTIKAKNPSDQRRMGQRKGLSAGDIKRIKNMYKC